MESIVEDAGAELASLTAAAVTCSSSMSLAWLIHDEMDENDLYQFCRDVAVKVVDVMPHDQFSTLRDAIVEKAKAIAAESVVKSLQEAAELSIAAQ